jgi:CheY-like chemotaxis protein
MASEAVNHRRMRIVPTRIFYLFAAFFILFCALVVGFWFFGGNVFSILLQRSRDYTPPQFLTWLSLASTLSIATVFCMLPFSLFRIVRQRSDVPFGWVVLCIAGFLFLCGITSVFGLFTIWFHGPLVIWGLIISRVSTALLAVATLLVLRALVPRILELPTQAEWLALNNDLIRVEASAEARQNLLSEVSHELRAPLAPLLATLTELEQRVVGPDATAVHDCIEVLRTNIRREARLVSDLLDRLEIPAAPALHSPSPVKNYPRPTRLLLVEDHEDTLRTFARLLRARGFHVEEAGTMSEAITCSRPGDLLVSDIGLPDGDGRDLMRQLGACGIPGIAISGFGSAKDIQEYKQAGFAESLIKPVDIDEVIGAINRVAAGATLQTSA